MARKFSEAREEILADPERRAHIGNEKAAMRLTIDLAALPVRSSPKKSETLLAPACRTQKGVERRSG